ncbi:MAG TPA: nuclear transport factor 2 family protein [Solirubrobacteraceae bacterium]
MSDALADELAIRKVLATYAHAIDRSDFELIATCYFEDADEDRGRFKGSIPEFIEWLTNTLGGFHSCWHLIGEPWIELDGDVAHVDTPCLGHHRLRNPAPGDAPDHLIPCRYLDRFERRDGEWRIASRRAVYEPVLAVTAGPELT